MKRKTVIGGLAALAAMVIVGGVGATAMAKGGHYYHGYRDGGAPGVMVEWLAEKLDLTDEQKAKLEPLKKKAIERRKEMRASHEAIHKEIMTQLAADTVDKARLAELAKMKEAEFAKTANMAVDGFAEFHALLTPEQRKSLVAKMEDKRKCRDGFMKRHGHRDDTGDDA